MFVALFFQPLPVTPFPFIFVRQATHCLFVALVLPPLALAHFFPLMLQALFFQPLAMPPLSFVLPFVASQRLFAPLVGLMTPMGEFPLLNVAFFLPNPFVVSAIEMIAGVT
jgi:hypothetical protein